jgi:hypothetical protein
MKHVRGDGGRRWATGCALALAGVAALAAGAAGANGNPFAPPEAEPLPPPEVIDRVQAPERAFSPLSNRERERVFSASRYVGSAGKTRIFLHEGKGCYLHEVEKEFIDNQCLRAVRIWLRNNP